ncbi:MAG: FHA domain-containing protein [Gemmatimonadales bacterium]
MTFTVELRLGASLRPDRSMTPDLGAERPRLATLLPRSVPPRPPIPVIAAASSLGSDPVNDVVIDGPGVAPRHARLDLHGGVWTLADFATASGTWVDQETVSGAAVLAPGSELRLGDVRLVFAPADGWREIAAERVRTPGNELLILPQYRRPWWPRALFVLAICGLIALAVLIFRNL